MRHALVTICTQSHLYKVKTLYDSIKKFDSVSDFHAFVVDSELNEKKEGIHYHGLKALSDVGPARAIIKKYKKHKDKLRWSLKPVAVLAMLNQYEKVIYLDNDICFYNSFDFLWKALDEKDILLTPHDYAHDPLKNQNWLEANFKVGLYNAGFIGVNKNAVAVMEWWANCCLYRCEKNYLRGLFDDQRYLDLVPIIHPNTKIVEHLGCNLAGWNELVRKRVVTDNGVLINGIWPVVFIHFNGFTVRQIHQNPGNPLKPYLDSYIQLLRSHKPGIRVEDLYDKEKWIDKIKLFIWELVNYLNTT